jgi:membrane-associated protein
MRQRRGRHVRVIALSLVERMVEWIQPAFVVAGYAIIAGGVFLERSVFVGLVVPGDVILALGGVYAAQGRMRLIWVIVLGTVAAIAGESTGYWLGRKYGIRLIRRLPLVRRAGGLFDNAQEFFRKHGGKTVAIGRYATAAGAFVPFSAGVGRMRYARFLAFDVPAIIVWAIGISVFGYFFGQHLGFVDKVLSRFGYTVLGLVIVYFGGRFLWKKARERRQQEESGQAEEGRPAEESREPE